MILVTIGGVQFANETLDDDLVRHKLRDLDGWFSTSYRTNFTERTNGDGDHVPGPTRRGSKAMTLKAVVYAPGARDAAEAAWETIAAVGGDGYDVPLRWEDTETGIVRTMTVRIDGTVEPVPFAPGKANVAIPLRAYDPRKYAEEPRVSDPARASGTQPYRAGLQYPLFGGAAIVVDPGGNAGAAVIATEGFDGANGQPWNSVWTELAESGDSTLQNGKGSMVAWNTGYTPVRQSHSLAYARNVEAYVEVTPKALTEQYVDITVRQSDRIGFYPDGYSVSLNLGGQGAGATWVLSGVYADNGKFAATDYPVAWEVRTYSIRLRAEGNVISAKVWPTGTPEPTDWQRTITDATFDRIGYVALGYISGDSTNPGVVWDNFSVIDLDGTVGATSYGWTGARGNSPSTQTVNGLVQRTNLHTNPSLENNTNGWGPNGGATIARSTDRAAVGSASLKVTGTGPTNAGVGYGISGLTPNETYTWSASVYLPTSNGILRPQIAASGAAFVSGTNFTNAARDQWVRGSVTFQANSTGTATLYVYDGGSAANENTGKVMYVDAAMIEQSLAMGTYFDGDTPGTGLATMSPALAYGALQAFSAARAENRGKAAVYPVMTVSGGAMPDGFEFVDQSDGSTVRFVGSVDSSETLVYDASTKRILSGTNDRTELLAVNDTMAIPAGEQRTYVFSSLGNDDTGTPTLTVAVTDAWW